MRLRDVLRRVMGVSYTAMKSAKWNGGITVDGVVTPVDAFVRAGQVVAIRFRENAPVYAVKPYDLPLTIAHEDDWLFVIDKPAPLASQSSALHPDDTLENALYAHLRCPTDFVYRPVNRLDKGTSGLMIVAKDAHIQHRLQALLHTPEFIRTYQAVVDGCPDDDCGVIDAPIGKEDAASIRRIVKRGKTRALVELVLETGRTHQIRVHMASIGCPVVGDFLYGTEIPQLPGRFALHASALTLHHPMTGEWLSLTSPLPASLATLLD